MERLTRAKLTDAQRYDALPEKVLQFGEGNFLRGFVDAMIHKLNEADRFGGRVVVVQPIEQGLTDVLQEQDGLYTLLLRGLQSGRVVEEREVVASISRGINPYRDYEGYLACAANPDLRFIVSNTTEAGIVYAPHDRLTDAPPSSFPAKLTVFLYERYARFHGARDKGLVLLPCELIERNGDRLKEIVLRLAAEWELGEGFAAWVKEANFFLNTLVDRIVTGYPKEEAEELARQLGYEDRLLNTAEPFHLWVIEGGRRFAEELPLAEAGLNVIWTEDMTPYRTRKVRILNGAHTAMVPPAFLYGLDTVKECMDDELVRTFMEGAVGEEIMPTLDLPREELESFAAAVSERFANPFIRHHLLSIALNSTSKFKTRVLPSLLTYVECRGVLPERLTFSLAALLVLYRGTELREGALIGRRADGEAYRMVDDLPVLELFRALWTECGGSREDTAVLVRKVLACEELWGQDLNAVEGLPERTAEYVYRILQRGAAEALKGVELHAQER